MRNGVRTLAGMLAPSRLRAFVTVGMVGMLPLLGGCSGFERMSDGDVDASQKEAASRIGNRLWQGCLTGQHQPLGEDEAIKEMRDGLTPQRMAGACTSARGQFGDFVSMQYAETWRPRGSSLRVYRFRGEFTNASGASAPEIRVVMDGAKLSGLWIKPWSDQLR